MSTIRTIRLASFVSEGICVASEDGDKVHEAIRGALKEGDNVQISFEGVEDLTSVFLNAAIGQLYGEFREAELRNRLSIADDASPQDLETLKGSVDRAKEYAKNPQRFHSATNEVLGDDSDQG